jgi:protease PrsW
MYCSQCGYQNSDTANFCLRCGNRLTPSAGATGGQGAQAKSAADFFGGFAKKVTDVAGLESAAQFKLRDLFSDVFKKHPAEEAELIFTKGSMRSTPDLRTVADNWPKPWLFSRVLLCVMLAFIGCYIGLTQFQNEKFIPGLIILGALAMPFSLLVFFYEANVPQNVSMYRVLQVFLVGGVLSLLFTLIFGEILPAGTDHIWSALLTGVIEESGKVLAILIFARNKKHSFILNGMLIGAAVGAGFATFETAGYIDNVLIEAMWQHVSINGMLPVLMNVTFTRAILSPGGHVAWAALTGGAIFMIKGAQDFRFSMLGDKRFLRIFAIVIVLHGIWDAPLPFSDMNGQDPYMYICIVISWIILFAFISTGLKQIGRIKQQMSGGPAAASGR